MACLRAGITVAEISQQASNPPATGIAGSTAPTVWSYKLHPHSGVEAGDQLWMSRYLMQRVSEAQGMNVTFAPGSGNTRCRTSVSTAATRAPGAGLGILQQHMMLLHAAKLQNGPPPYCPASPADSFTPGLRVGVGRSAESACDVDVVIPSTTLLQQCGEWTDCRPASDADPYAVATSLLQQLKLDSSTAGTKPPPSPYTYHHHHPPEHWRPDCTLAGSVHTQSPYTQADCYGSDTHELFCVKPSPASSASLDILCEQSGDCSEDDSLDTMHSDEADSGGACDSPTSSMNSEDLLLDELDRMDRRRKAPKRSYSNVSMMSPLFACEQGEASSGKRCMRTQPAEPSPADSEAWASEGFGESCSYEGCSARV